jgi:PAS domain S-box-containing protein
MPRKQHDRASLAPALIKGVASGLLLATPLGLAAALLGRLAASMRAAFDYAVDGILTLDDAGTIHSLNPAAERIFGYQAPDVAGRHIRLLIPDPLHHSQYRLLSAGSEVTGRRKDGTTFPMELTSGKMGAGERRMYIVIARDSTRRKQIEAELRQARAAAEAASRTKSAFLATMSHELRTPLNAIIGYSEMLQEEAEGAGYDDLTPDLQRINGAGRRLLGLIGDILEIAQLESGTVEPVREPFDIAALAEEVAAAGHPLAEQNGNILDLRCRADIGTMRGDRSRVRQALLGVVENACKFTEHGTITLRVERMNDEGRRMDSSSEPFTLHPLSFILFEVTDTGIGMTPEQIDGIFEPFAQADDSFSRRYGGAGLGLAIARRFCELMGGEIAVTSAVGEGSTFTIRLPATP